jgi:hypothetical protein
MKKCAFISIIRKPSILGITYDIIYDVKPRQAFSELVDSLYEFEKIEIVDFKNLQSDVNLFIAFDCVDVNEYFNAYLSEFLKPLNCKSVFIDFSTYDNQEISEEDLDTIETLTDKPIYFVTKNLLQNRDNHLYFEELAYHHIREDREIPRHYNAYLHFRLSQRLFWPKFKGFYYPGHTRIHKVKYLEFLYQNNYLDSLIWSCTGLDFDKGIIRELVPIEYEEEFNSFEVLKLLPKAVDFDIYTREKYEERGGNVNLVTYLDSCFEIVPETRFYDQSGNNGSKKTYKTWNNISEKIMKPTLLGQPFILISKPNTIKLLKERGIDYEYDFWKFDYDSIENNDDRMTAIQEFTHKVMSMSIKELSEFNNDYHQWSKPNYNKFIDAMYKTPVNNIWHKL